MSTLPSGESYNLGTATTGTIDLINYQQAVLYVRGSVTLTGNLSFTSSETVTFPRTWVIIWDGVVTPGINSVSIFGTPISAAQMQKRGVFTIVVNYAQTDFRFFHYFADDQTDFLDGAKLIDATVDGGKIVDVSIPGSKIAPNTLTADKLSAVLQAQTPMIFLGSFEAGEQTTVKYLITTNITLSVWHYTVVKAIAGTDAATATITTAMGTAATINIPASTALGQEDANVITVNNNLVIGDYLEITYSKPTAGGKIQLDINYTLTP